MAEAIYILCALTSAICVVLLYRGWRTSRNPLLFWSCLCFIGFTLNNAILFVDLVMVPSHDLSIVRLLPALAGVAALLYALIWEAE